MKIYTNVEEAIDAFYKNNGIPRNHYLSDQNTAYTTYDKDFDYYINEDTFPNKVYSWLQTFENKDLNIFLNLLGNYTYITQREYTHKLSLLSQSIENKLTTKNISFSDTIFVTVSSPHGIKCGGDDIRAHFNQVNMCRNITNDQIISSMELINPQLFSNKKAIVFIDDLVGTGYTIINTIEKTIDFFSQNNISLSTFQYFFTGIIINPSATKTIVNHFKSSPIVLSPIISTLPKKLLKGDILFSNYEISHVRSVIEHYEKLIDNYQFTQTKKAYAMGFKEGKLSISFYYNTPNNTLCNFWEYSDSHIPLFERRSQSRPIINDFKKRKENIEINAYLQKAIENETL